MSKDVVITQEAFDNLLHWLDPDRDLAGVKYETIRLRIIKIFTCRGCSAADELADETINRVTLKLKGLTDTYVGDPALYFYGVANNVFLEYLRPPRKVTPVPEPADDVEVEYECLEKCMAELSETSRELVLHYYQDDKRAKIDHRKEMADRLGIAMNALRIRAHRIRKTLQACVEKCLEQQAI
jgi:DNA-directed RNA polymerase specialized sigma24 family protein